MFNNEITTDLRARPNRNIPKIFVPASMSTSSSMVGWRFTFLEDIPPSVT